LLHELIRKHPSTERFQCQTAFTQDLAAAVRPPLSRPVGCKSTMVSRWPDPADRRAVRLAAPLACTGSGGGWRPQSRANINYYRRSWSEPDREVLATLLSRFVEQLGGHQGVRSS
jgi:hypothetical protein